MEYELYHHGVKGQKWGVRRYQYSDGSLTTAGKKREAKQLTKQINRYEKKAAAAYGGVYSNVQFKSYYAKKHDKALSKDKVKKAEKYLQKSKMHDQKAKDLVKEFNSNSEKIASVKKLVSENSNYMITYKRAGAASGSTVDGGVLTTEYDKTKVRLNTDKNRKKYANKQKQKGYGLTATYTYYV